MNKTMVTIALNKHELETLAQLQNITTYTPKNTIMLAVVCLLYNYNMIEQAKARRVQS